MCKRHFLDELQMRNNICNLISSNTNSWQYSNIVPFGVSHNDILSVVGELPIEDLFDNKGSQVDWSVVLKRSVEFLIAKGRVNCDELRKKVLSVFYKCYSEGSISLADPIEKADVVYMFCNNTTVYELLKLLPSRNTKLLPNDINNFINSKDIAVLPKDHPIKMKAARRAKQKARKKAKREASIKKNILVKKYHPITDEMLIDWLKWYHGGMGVDSRGIDPQKIIETVKTLDIRQFTHDEDDWHYAVLYECIRRNKPTKRRRTSGKGREFCKTYATQCTNKGFFNVLVRR